ncbi:hypothetical protein [Nitrobacter hamburgensis]|uniref:hypothetical protein n=1 Tax=Nitrobacter hamburgensis TaxID=912 RepID=UPI0012EE97F0|nr:hypothetical protein [Nitrobacter hamburgensis]
MASVQELEEKCSLRRLSEHESMKALETAIRDALLTKISRITASIELAEARRVPRKEVDDLLTEARFLDHTLQYKISRLAGRTVDSSWWMRTFGYSNPLA